MFPLTVENPIVVQAARTIQTSKELYSLMCAFETLHAEGIRVRVTYPGNAEHGCTCAVTDAEGEKAVFAEDGYCEISIRNPHAIDAFRALSSRFIREAVATMECEAISSWVAQLEAMEDDD